MSLEQSDGSESINKVGKVKKQMSELWMSLVGRESLIAADDMWGLLAVMTVSVYLAIRLEQKYRWASKLSGCVIALLIAMALANLGVVPTSCVLYDDIVWGVIVPLGIPMMLLNCNLKRIWAETGRMLVIFLFGAVGTVAGAYLAFLLLKGPYSNVNDLARVASMLTGSYIGGSVNLAAMASQYAAREDVTAAAIVADNLLMAIYFFVLIFFAGNSWFRKKFRHPLIDEVESGALNEGDTDTLASAFWSRKDISLKDIAVNIGYAAVVVWVSRLIAGVFGGFEPAGLFMTFVVRFFGSQYVWITTISVLVATFMSEVVKDMHGSQEIGTYCIYLFLFVIGVPANIFTVVTKSPLFLVLAAIIVFVNMVFCFVAAKLFGFNLEDAIIASNANIGGPTTAAGMAISQGWIDLVGPAMLIGTLGYVLGNYLGTVVAVTLGL